MKEVVNYIADDGTIFEDEDECREYERKIALKSYYGFKVFRYDFEEIEPDPENLSNIYYILMEKDNNLITFLRKCENDGYGIPYTLYELSKLEATTHIYYDECEDEFFSLEDKIKEYSFAINKMDLAQ